MSPLAVLVLRSLRGRTVRWLRLLRTPRYAVGLVATIAYYSMIFRTRLHGSQGRGLPQLLPGGQGDLIALFGALMLAGLVTITWAFPGSVGLRFTSAEVQHLFPAPIGRRALLRYALLKAQPAILMGSLFSTLVIGRGAFAHRLALVPLTWVAFTAWQIHATGVGVFKARLAELSRARARARIAAVAALFVLFWLAVLLTGMRTWNAMEAGAGADLASLNELARQGGLLAVLGPLRWIVRGMALGTPLQRLEVAAALLAGAAIVMELCARSGLSFEEASLTWAERQAERRIVGPRAASERKSREKWRTRRPVALAPRGIPEVAVFWKGLLLATRRPLGRTAARVGAWLAVVAALGFTGRVPAPIALSFAVVAVMSALFMAIVGGTLFRIDLRSDLLALDTLRSWPLTGWRVVLAEAAAPATIAACWSALAVISVVALRIGMALGRGGMETVVRELPGLPMASRSVASLALAALAFIIFASALSLFSCVAQNVFVLMFPGWVQLGPMRQPGAALMGQRLIAMLGLLFVLVFGLLPGGLVVAALVAAGAAAGITLAAWQLPILAVIAVAPLAVEAFALCHFGGRAWDRLDPSRELLEPAGG